MKLNFLPLIKGDDINIVYHYPTYNIMMINDISFHVIELLKSGLGIQEITDITGHSKGELDSFIRSISRLENMNSGFDETENSKRRILERITLHVSNDCNLRCKYCFAGGGNYKQPRGMMTIQTAEKFVNFCVKTFDKINQIVFLGGEPMLNVEVMEFVCNQFKNYYSSGQSSFLPNFSIITNGTILTPKALELINTHISFITVSIDGPEEINDINRTDINGKGSYSKIAEFIRTIHEETDVQVQYEATFTQSHIDASYSHKSIAAALRSEFDMDGLIVNDTRLPFKQMLNNWQGLDIENLKETDFDDMPKDFWHVLHAIVSKEPCIMCPIVKDIFAIGTDGTLYPCHKLNGVSKGSLGTIYGENIFNTLAIYTSFFSNVRMKKSDTCKECWAQGLCGGCTLDRFYNEDTEEFMMGPKVEICEITRLYLEQMLLVIATIRKNTYLWEILLEKQKQF